MEHDILTICYVDLVRGCQNNVTTMQSVVGQNVRIIGRHTRYATSKAELLHLVGIWLQNSFDVPCIGSGAKRFGAGVAKL